MNPMLFGNARRTLFGVYTPAAGARRRTGAVLCAPFGQEYLRSHRAFKVLSDRLAAAGIDVLRFDYYGTGDSAGESREVTLSGCVEDAGVAIDEISAIAAVKDVTVIGLRLGGTIALTASRQRTAVSRAVLWDPILDGRGLIDELDDSNRSISDTIDGTRIVGGFPVTAQLQREIGEISPDGLRPGSRRTLLIASRPMREYDAWASHSENDVEHASLDGSPAWEEHDDLGVGMLPVRIIEKIVEWCA